MEAINVALTQPLRFRSSIHGALSSNSKEHGAISGIGFPCRRRGQVRILAPGFRDQGHVDYYGSSSSARKMNSVVCAGGIEKIVADAKKGKKKQMNLLKGISKDLLTLSQISFENESGADHHSKGHIISEAAELLLEQLQKLKASESSSSSESSDGECAGSADPVSVIPPILSIPLCNPEMDSGIGSKEQQKEKLFGEEEKTTFDNMAIVDGSRKCGKDEKIRSKASKKLQRNVTCETSSSSSSSESSDSECDEVVDLENLRLGQIQQNIKPQEAPTPIIETAASFQSKLYEPKPLALLPTLGTENRPKVQKQEDIGKDPGSLGGVNSTKIEVCMGGKCKKSGAGALLEEFQRVVGIEGEVTGCKCMGKCKEGPNVKVDENSLCMGVGIEDVGVIVTNFLGKNEDQLGFATSG